MIVLNAGLCRFGLRRAFLHPFIEKIHKVRFIRRLGDHFIIREDEREVDLVQIFPVFQG